MSSPDSVKPNSLEINKASSPLKQLDNSYDSRESPRDPDQQKTDPTVKKVKKAVRKQSAQQNPEDPAKDNADLEKTDNVNPEAQDQADKKKKKKKAKKTEENPEDQGSNVTANFSKQSTERKVPENSETNQQTQKETEQENNATKPKKTKKKAPVITEDANEAAEVPQEEKPKTVKKKVAERKDEVKAESPVNGGNNKLVKKNSDPAAQKGAKADKPKELQKIENIKPQTKQGSRSTKNIEVAEPTVTKSALVNALVSPKANGKNKKNTNVAENERLSKNTWNTQAKEDEEVFVPVGKAAALKKSPTQEELSAASPKAKLGPIRSKIETGLSTLRPTSKTVDVSTVSFAATTRNNKSVRSPDNAGLRRGYDANGQKSYADMSGTQKSYMLEKLDTQAESRKKNSNNKKEKPRMRSFDAGKTDKINSEDTFEARNRMWQVRKAEKLMEEEKKKSREQNDACTFNPQLVTRRFAPLDVSTTSVYDRGLEWTQKVKSAVQAKGDLLLEEKKKADPKKPRIKSITGPTEIRSSKVYIEGFTGPQFGVPKTMNVPSYSQEPLKFSGNLEQKISEINDVYESVSAALKKKSANTKTGFKEAPKSSYGEVKSVSRISVSSQKERGKVEAVAVNKGDDQRMNTLKQMLNLNQKEKKVQEQNADYFGGKEDEKERIVPKSGQRVEIKNNRYVIVDENAEC